MGKMRDLFSCCIEAPGLRGLDCTGEFFPTCADRTRTGRWVGRLAIWL
jgi:hypothetical protein